MIIRYATAPAICLALASQAQNLNNVLFNPASIHECEFVNLTVLGNYPSPNYTFDFYSFDPGTFTFVFYATGVGNSPQTNFSEPIPPLGPWEPGTYLFTAQLNLNGTVVDTWTTNLTVLPQVQHDPGIDTFAEVCNTGSPYPLVTLLDGTPQSGGQWLDPNGVPHGPNLTPGLDPAGVWIYQFLAPLPCHTDTIAQLFLAYLPNNSAGFDGVASVCSTDPPIALIDHLFGTPTPGGTWTGPSPTTGNYDPATMTPGVYTYTVPGIPPCSGPSATVTVSEMTPNNAGTGSDGQVCADVTNVLLNTYLSGGPQTTGSWVDPLGFPFGGYNATFNAQEDFVGTYLYIVNNGTCPADTAFVTMSLIANNTAGIGGTAGVCVTDVLVDLFGLLGGFPTPGGTWTGPGGGPFDGTYDPDVDPPGDYTYNVDGIPPCPDPSAVLTVVEQPLSEAGVGDSAFICILDTMAELYYHLSGAQTTGYWFTPVGDTIGDYFATINAMMSDPGSYLYVVNNAPCAPDTAIVVVSVLPTPCQVGLAEEDDLPPIMLSVQPNPSEGSITVVFRSGPARGPQSLEVLDMNGRTLWHEPLRIAAGEQQMDLDLSALPAGAYLLRMRSPDGTAVRRFMLH